MTSLCNLIGNPIAILVQFGLGLVMALTLVVKWRLERPRRRARVWIFDALKQAIAAGVQHGCNVVIAAVVRSEGGEGDEECGWYMVSFTIDACLGTGLSLLLLRYAVEPLARRYAYRPLIESGDYGQPDNIRVRWWAIQLASWLGVNVLARALCGTIIGLLHDDLTPFVRWLSRQFKGEAIWYLLVSMVGTPAVFNVVQVIIQDTCLKKRSSGRQGGAAAGRGPTSGATAGFPLVRLKSLASDDEEDDDHDEEKDREIGVGSSSTHRFEAQQADEQLLSPQGLT